MTQNANLMTELLSQLESTLTEKHGAQGGNLLEKVSSLKGLLPDDLQEKMTGLLGQFGGEGGIGSLLAMLGGGNAKDDSTPKPEVKQEHIDGLRGVMGELQSFLGEGADADGDKKGAQKKDGDANDGGGLGGMIGDVLKSLTDQ